VDFKLSAGRLGKNQRLQLVAYGALLQESWELPACRGFVYYIAQRRAVEVPFTPQLWAEFEQDLTAMHTTVELERMPPPTRSRAVVRHASFAFSATTCEEW